MNVPQSELDSLYALSLRLKDTISNAHIARPGDKPALLEEAGHLAANMGVRLEQAGAQRPATSTPAPAVPLHLLDTPANRRYAEKLREAWEAGMAVDRERYGPNIGTDGCAQIIEMVLADVEAEIHGPAGAGE